MLRRNLLVWLFAVLFTSQLHAAENPHVVMKTNLGVIELELFAEQAPITVENFLGYVDSGFYNGTIFHRVIAGFMIQGGGFDKEMQKKKTKDPIKNESGNGLSNLSGTISMARLPHPDTATAQFFINTVNNRFLDQRGNKPGYAVFGRVVKGMDNVMKISRQPTGTKAGRGDVPKNTILIESISRL